ncbi:choice-of-anchor D domain-containing protein, partial [Akkermansiaceae bacterium]|nr:choice-of-anchor D domain-containing protein [Akkermansiaceae bacterium]
MTTFRFFLLSLLFTGLPFAQTISVSKGGDPVEKNETITLPNSVTIGNSVEFDLILAEEGDVNVSWDATLVPATDFSLSTESGVINDDKGPVTLRVVFNPTASGQRTATLTILTRDATTKNPKPADDESFTINLVGEGRPPAEIEVKKDGNSVEKNGTISLPNAVIGRPVEIDLFLAEKGDVNVAWSATLDPASDFSLSTESGVINNDGGPATLKVIFNPTASGQGSAILSISIRDARDDPDPENDESFTINLVGEGLLPAEITVEKGGDVIESGSSATFPEIDRSGTTTSEDLEFTILNEGQETLTITTVEFDPPGGPFSLIENPGSLPGSANGALTVRFTPTTTGGFSTSLKINSNDADKTPFIVNLEGSAIAPQFGFKDKAGNSIAGGVTQKFDDAIIADGTVAGEVREATFSVHQLGKGDLNWNAALTNSDHFQIVGISSGTIRATTGAQSQDLVIRFAPTVEGDLTSTLTITSNDPDSPSYQLAITGTGLTPAEIEVFHGSESIVNGGTLDFENIDLQSASKTRTLTLRIKNLGNEPLTIPTELTDFRIEADPSSSIPDEFKVIEPLPLSLLSKNQSTSLLIRFEPQESGQRSATLSFANNDRSRTPFTVQLEGEATRPAIFVRTPGGRVTSTRSPSSFGFTPLGNSSTIEFTIENPGTAPVQDLSVALSASEHYTISQNISRNILEAGGSAKFTVTFTPSTSSVNLQDSVIVSGSNVSDWEFTVTGDSTPPADSQPDQFGYFYQKEIALTSDFLTEDGAGVSEVSLTTGSVQSINIGFPFKFYENTYGVCSVSEKGLITFENDSSVYGSPHQLPSPGIKPSNLIAPFWANLRKETDSKIRYSTRGVSPGRVFNVQYTNFYLGNSNTKITFSMLLFEGTNSIEFHYREISGSISPTSNKLSVGIQNKNGDSGVGYWFGQLDGTPAPGFDQDGFIEFPSAIKFVRPIKARVVSAYRGRANDGTRIRCDSTSGLVEGMFVQAIDSDGLLLPGTKILEIIDHQTIRVNQAATRDEAGISIEATSYDPRLVIDSPEPIRYSQSFDDFGNGTRDLNDGSRISGETPQVDNGSLYLTYDSSAAYDAAIADFGFTSRSTTAATFDGSNIEAFNFGAISGDATFEFILSGDPVAGGNNGYIGRADANPGNSLRYEQWSNTGALGFTRAGVADNTFSAPNAASPTDDTHVTYRWTQATRTMDLFINGVATDSIAGATFEMPTGPGHLGNVSEGGNEGMIGTISRVTTFNSALSDSDILSHSNAWNVAGGGRSSFSIPALAGSSEGFEVSFDFTLTNSGGKPADGFSLNYGNALLGALGSEEGMQDNPGVTENLSFEVDTYYLGSSELGVGISGIVDGVTQGNWAFTNGPILTTETRTGRATFSWNPQDGASFTTTGLRTNANFSNVQVGGFEGNDSFTFNISARIGGANQTLSIDNLEIVTSGSPQIVDPRIRVVILNCSTDISSSGMLTSVGYPFINSSGGLEVTDLGFDPLPGEIYTFPHGEEQTFVSPPSIYLNKNYEPLTEPGTPPLIVDASSLPDDVAVYRLVTDGYSVAGQVVQGANTSFSEILEEDVTVVWRWKLEYAVFIQTASTLNGAPVSLQGGVGNPSPGVGRHWVSANQDFTASIDREIGEGILGSAPTGFRYSTQEYSIGYQGDFSGSSRVSAGNDGNQITTAPITIDNWASVRWHTKAQVLYQFDAKRLSGTESDDDFLGHSFIRVKDSSITKTLVAVDSLDQTIRIPVPFFTSDDLTVKNKTSAEPLTAEDDYIAIPGTPAGNNNGAIRLIGSRKVKIGDLIEIEASAENTTYFGHNALNRQWINIGAEVCVGAFYRTEDRCFTLGDFTSRPGGDLGALGLDSTELKDAIFRENGYLHSANSQPRVARVFKVARVQRPTEVHFVYEPTVFRVELPFGKSFDASDPNLQLVPDFCEGMALRTNSEGPSDQHTASLNDSSGGAVGLPYRWDQLGKRLFPVHPGTFEISWPDAIDQEKVHRIEVVAGYPNNTVGLVSAREEESGLRQTTTGLSTEDLIENGFKGVVDSEESDHVFETDLPAVSSDFPGSQPDGLDAHYRYLRDNNQERQAPTKLDLATTDQWKFTQMPYQNNGARVDEASDGIPFSANEDGRCVLLYSYRPNPDEIATGDLTKESLAVRVVRSEELDPLLPENPRLVLGTYGLILDGSKNLGVVERRGASQTIDPGNEFVLDFWLNASGFASDDGEVSIIATRGDNLKVTLDNHLSLKEQTVSGPTDSIAVPFSFTDPGQVRVSNLTSGLTLESTIDYTAGPGSPQGMITLLGTEKVSPGDTIRVSLIESRAPAPTIRATYRGVTVSHDFEKVGPKWRHYLVHVFTNEFLGLSTTSIHFYADGKLEHTARMTSQLSNGSAVFEVSDSVDSSSLRLGQGAEASSRLLLDQLRIYKPNSPVAGESSWLSSGEINKLRNERNPILRGADPELWFSFEADPSSDTGTGMTSFIEGQNASLATMGIGPITAETGSDSDSNLYRSTRAKVSLQEVATRIESTLDNAGFDGDGYILNRVSNYNAKIYDREAEVGFWGPLYPVNRSRVYDSTKSLEVAYYENSFRNDEFLHPNVAWPYVSAAYQQVVYPQEGPHARNAVYIASRLGSEGVDRDGRLQKVYGLDQFANLTIYNQPSRNEAGFNPNEEHAIAAPSNRAALKIKEKGETLPNNPPLAAFALQADNNTTTGANYTSEPWVLVQFDNLKTGEKEMGAYYVARERIGPLGIGTFPRISDEVVNETEGLAYESAPNPEDRFLTLDPSGIYNFRYAFDYKVNAGDLMIPPYPLNLVIGNTPMPASGGGNDASQRTVWADVNGNHWVVSGGGRFTFKYFYPFRDDFYLNSRPAKGAPVPWVPDADTSGLRSFTGSTENLTPGRVSYSSYWATDYPKIKRGETLTYQGGEYFNENPGAEGLPALVAMAAAEIVYDSGTSSMVIGEDNINNYSARIIRPLDRYESPFTVAQMDAAGFSPASPKISVIAERWYFTDLPGSLQARFYFDSLAEKLVFRGYLNGKDSGDPDLTAGPDPLNLLEPSLLTDDEKTQLDSLAEEDAEWKAAVRTIFERAKNPMLIRDESTAGKDAFTGRYLSGMKEAPIVTQRIGLNLQLAENRANAEEQQARLDALRNQQEELEGERRSYSDFDAFWISLFSPSYLRDLDSDIAQTRRASNDSLGQLQSKQLAINALNVQISNLPNKETSTFSHLDSFGAGAALVQNPSLFLSTDKRYITIAENNRSELDGAAVSLHIIEIIPDRYRGALKVVEGTNPFSEKITIQHNGEFGANTKDLYYEWWIRDAGPLDLIANEISDDGTLAEVGSSGQTLWQQYLPKNRASDDSLTENQKRQGLHSIVFEGRPDVTLADKLVLMRYRHKSESDWRLVPFEFTDASSAWANGTQAGAGKEAPFQWAGAANSPQLQADGSKRYIPQLVMGWVKRVLDRINPYEARYNDFFSSESPAVYSSQIQIAGAPFAGAVALNPDKNVIENVGLIELYETILKRAKDLTIDNSSNAVSTEGVNQAILLAATRLAVLYELLAREAYSDAQDNTITVSDDGGLTNVASFTHAFQNFEPSLLHEELALLRGTDFRKSYPVFNRMFWNFTKGLGEAAYAVNYNVYDENTDGFINEDDARALYPQGHGDSWGHFLSALGMHYELLQQPVFKWSTRSELYSLMENVLEVDYLDEQTFASLAAGKALAGRDIVRNTYRLK